MAKNKQAKQSWCHHDLRMNEYEPVASAHQAAPQLCTMTQIFPRKRRPIGHISRSIWLLDYFLDKDWSERRIKKALTEEHLCFSWFLK